MKIPEALFANRHPSLHKPRMVLVVDDECGIRDLLVVLLRHYGYSAVSAGTPREALAMVEGWGGEPIDLLVTDLAMPGMNGDALAGKLRELQPALKVIFISGYSVNDPVAANLDLRNATFLRKPTNIRALDDAVRALFQSESSCP
jgi:two-component system, cell cycle sensor histidine kinase and response regulator CckA